MEKFRKLSSESLEPRRVLAASLGWDGPGTGSADLTYYLGDAPGYIGQEKFEAAIKESLNAWSQVADINFTETNQPGQRDSLDFTFENLDGSYGTLAQAYFPDDINPARIAGDVQFDAAERWEIGNALGRSAFDLVSVAVHEIGHALGLQHLHDSDAVLFPSLSANTTFDGLSEHDIEGIQELYAPPATDNQADNAGTELSTQSDEGAATGSPSGSDSERTEPTWRFRWFSNGTELSRFGNRFRFSGFRQWSRITADESEMRDRTDVNQDTKTSAVDALIVINALNSGAAAEALRHQCDVNGDGTITAVDALAVINSLNSQNAERVEQVVPAIPGAGEASSQADGDGASNDGAASEESDEDNGLDPEVEHDYLERGIGFGLGVLRGSWVDQTVDALFAGFDENEDGSLTEGEVPGVVWRYMLENGVDGDGNEEISLQEIDAALEAKRLDRFRNLDENEDGQLSEDEVRERLWRKLQHADSNDDGGVTYEELEAFRNLTPFRSAFERLDVDGDGQLTEGEVRERLWDRLIEHDDNQDGAITEDELPPRDSAPPRPVQQFAKFAGKLFRRFRDMA